MNYNVKWSFYYTMQFIEREFMLYADNEGFGIVDFEYYDPDVLYVYYCDEFANGLKKDFDTFIAESFKALDSDSGLVDLVESGDSDALVKKVSDYLNVNGITLWWNDSVLGEFYNDVEGRIESLVSDRLNDGFKFIEEGISTFAGSGDFSYEDGDVRFSSVEDLIDNITVVVSSDKNLFWDDVDLAFSYLKYKGVM